MDTGDLSYQNFVKGNFEESAANLRALLQKNANDPKVLHNLYVNEFYASNQTKINQFLDNMRLICYNMGVNIDDISTMHYPDQAIYFYNFACVLLYYKQYKQALFITEPLFNILFTIESYLAIQICFMLINLYLKNFQHNKAFKIINFTESLLNGNCENECSYISLKIRNCNDLEKKAFTTYLRQCKLQYFLSSDDFNGETEENTQISSALDNYLKGEYNYITGGYRKSLSIINQSQKIIADQYYSTNMVGGVQSNNNNLNINYVAGTTGNGMGKQLPIKYISSCFYNNLALNHLSLNKANLAVFYLRKALQENEDLIGDFPDPAEPTANFNCGKPLYTFAYDRRHDILHNLAINLLHAKKPLPAFDCLIEIVGIYHCNPRIWLRLAECCIMVATKGGNEDNFSLKRKLQSAVQHIIGFGHHRKSIVVPLNTPTIPRPENVNTFSPTANLDFAILCLRNALTLVERLPVAENIIDDIVFYNMAPSNPITQDERAILKGSILASLSFCELSVGNYFLAQEYAFELDELIKTNGSSIIIKYLSQLYIAESFVLDNKVKEALPYLDFDAICSVDSVIMPNSTATKNSNQQDKEKTENMLEKSNNSNGSCITQWNSLPIIWANTKTSMITGSYGIQQHHRYNEYNIKEIRNMLTPSIWVPCDLSSARLIMHYNLCVCYTYLGEYEKASHMLRNNIPFKSTEDLPYQFIMLALYLSIQLGHLDMARMIILQNFAQIQH